MSSHVEKIKEKLSIVDVVGSYVTLEKAGANFKIKCPFHNEKTASCYVSPDRNTYYCFGCGAKGDIFSFVQEFEGLDFIGALRVLAKRAGVELTRENPAIRTERERLYLALEYATLFFQKQLSINVEAKKYLAGRGLLDATIKDWRVGYAPVDWKGLSTYLQTKGVSLQDMERVGLIKKSEKIRGDHYDRFRGRIMFPIFDSSGRVVAFSGRQFQSDGTQAKYLNSPETVLFEKSKILYGYDKAKLEIRKAGYSLLVEGQMDLLMSHQGGFTNTVATSGTALTTDHLEMLKRLAEKIVIAYDGDAAGSSAAKRGWEAALGLGMDVQIAQIPDAKDPADLIKEDPEAYKKVVASARHGIDVEIDRVMQGPGDDRQKMMRMEKEVLPIVAVLSGTAEKSHFVSKIAHALGAKDTLIWEAVRTLERKRANPQYGDVRNTALPKNSRKEAIERRLWALILWQEKQPSPVVNTKELRDTIVRISGGTSTIDIDKIQDELIFEAELSYSQSQVLPELVNELTLNFKEEHVRDAFALAMKNLHKAERDKDAAAVTQLLKECQRLSDELKSIHISRKAAQ